MNLTHEDFLIKKMVEEFFNVLDHVFKKIKIGVKTPEHTPTSALL